MGGYSGGSCNINNLFINLAGNNNINNLPTILLVPGQFGPEERERESIDGVSRIGPTILWAETLKY